MPWSQTMPRDQRVQFIADYLRNTLSMTELCDLYHVSRKTGYKWVQRYLRRGPIGLEELSRKPRVSPNQTPTRWWRRSWRLAATIPAGELRNCSRSSARNIRAGLGRIEEPSARF